MAVSQQVAVVAVPLASKVALLPWPLQLSKDSPGEYSTPLTIG